MNTTFGSPSKKFAGVISNQAAHESTLYESGNFSTKFKKQVTSPMLRLEMDTFVVSRANLSIANAALRSKLPENQFGMVNSYEE